jgi:hypothetical protein
VADEQDVDNDLAARIVDNDLAARIVDQALVFLQACADNPHRSLTPSPLVDHGWHAFLLHTSEYAQFCDTTASRFIHHHPLLAGEDGPVVSDTIQALEATGLEVDVELWTCGGDCQGRCRKCKNCHQCHGGCTDSP